MGARLSRSRLQMTKPSDTQFVILAPFSGGFSSLVHLPDRTVLISGCLLCSEGSNCIEYSAKELQIIRPQSLEGLSLVRLPIRRVLKLDVERKYILPQQNVSRRRLKRVPEHSVSIPEFRGAEQRGLRCAGIKVETRCRSNFLHSPPYKQISGRSIEFFWPGQISLGDRISIRIL